MSLFSTISRYVHAGRANAPRNAEKPAIKEASFGQAAKTSGFAAKFVADSTGGAQRTMDSAIRKANFPGVNEREALTGLTGSSSAAVDALTSRLDALAGIPLALVSRCQSPSDLVKAITLCMPDSVGLECGKQKIAISNDVIKATGYASELADGLAKLSGEVRQLAMQGRTGEARAAIEKFMKVADTEICRKSLGLIGADPDRPTQRPIRDKESAANFLLSERLQALRQPLRDELKKLAELTANVSVVVVASPNLDVLDLDAAELPHLPPLPPLPPLPALPQAPSRADAIDVLRGINIDAMSGNPVARAILQCKAVQRPAERWPGRSAEILAQGTPLAQGDPTARLLNKSFKVAHELPAELAELAARFKQKIESKDAKGARAVLSELNTELNEVAKMAAVLRLPKVHALFRGDGEGPCKTLADRLEGLIGAVNEQFGPLSKLVDAMDAMDAAKVAGSNVGPQTDAAKKPNSAAVSEPTFRTMPIIPLSDGRIGRPFWDENDILSNFAATPLSVDVGAGERRYNSAEHAFQEAKVWWLLGRLTDKNGEAAKVCRDVLEKIRRADTGRSAQKAVKPLHALTEFIYQDWLRAAPGIMKKILKAKVVASPETERTLRATANHVLFEESKHDNFWGTGLKAADPRTLDPKNWGAAIPHKKRIARKDGGNHLGKLWMQVREELPPLQN